MTAILVVGTTAPSHTRPHLAVVQELVARGHDVTYLVGAPLGDLVAATGARVVTHPTLLPTVAADDSGAWPDDLVAGMRLFLEENIAVLPYVLALPRPEAVLYDIGSYAGLVAAHRWGVPAAVLSPAMVAWEGYEEDMAEATAALEASPAWAPYAGRFDAWFAEHDMPRRWQDAMGHPERGLVLLPRAMQPHADRVPASLRFVGPCLEPARLAERWAPAVTGRRVLYVAFGTAYTNRPALLRAAAEAVAGEDWHVVLSVGGQVDPAQLAGLPGSVEVHARVPQLAVLEHADVFVTHAGMGSCSETLWQGVPAVAVPAAVDQFFNADLLQGLGVARHVPEAEATPETLRAAIAAMTDPAVRARAAALREEVRAQGGAPRAADALEVLLREGT